MKERKTGILGGTFDPVHNGHLAVAEEARKVLGLDEVVLVPAGRPMSRVNQKVTAAEHRVKMLNLAVKGHPGLNVSTMEIERTGPTFTIDTIKDVQRRSGKKTAIYFIMGWDSLEQMPSWKEPERLVELCSIVAAPRPGYVKPDINWLEEKIPGIKKKVLFLDEPVVDISARVIRERAGRGEDISGMVPGEVAEYIRENRIYEGSKQ
jgi:nicotinate-nucleotide adenylyltransferase